jgi:hypothetical protein
VGVVAIGSSGCGMTKENVPLNVSTK